MASTDPSITVPAEDASKASSTGTGGVSMGGHKSLPGSTRRASDAASASASPAPGTAAAAGLPPVTSAPRGEDSLSATLERLRLNAQAAKNGAAAAAAAGGGAGPGSPTQVQGGGGGYAAAARRSANASAGGPPPGSRLGKAAAAAAQAAQAAANNGAAAARAGQGIPSAGAAAQQGQETTQMGNFVFDDELDAELHSEFSLSFLYDIFHPFSDRLVDHGQKINQWVESHPYKSQKSTFEDFVSSYCSDDWGLAGVQLASSDAALQKRIRKRSQRLNSPYFRAGFVSKRSRMSRLQRPPWTLSLAFYQTWIFFSPSLRILTKGHFLAFPRM